MVADYERRARWRGTAERVVGDIRLGSVGGGGKESLARCWIGIGEGRGRSGRVGGGAVRSLAARAVLEAVEGEDVCGQRTSRGRRPCAINLPDAHVLIKSPAVVGCPRRCAMPWPRRHFC